VLAKGIKTPDIGGSNKTDDVMDAVIAELKKST
jgi:isocitrate/isopropylmalate dehydrogenase